MKNGIKHGIMQVAEINVNPSNPRIIKDKEYQRLKSSVKNFPEMLYIRPIVVDENNMVMGGNMRLTAVKDLGWEKVPVIFAQTLSESQKKEFSIKDNINSGEWDYTELSTWTEINLSEWALICLLLGKLKSKHLRLNLMKRSMYSFHLNLSF